MPWSTTTNYTSESTFYLFLLGKPLLCFFFRLTNVFIMSVDDAFLVCLFSTKCLFPVYWIIHSRYRTLNMWSLPLADDPIKRFLSAMCINSIHITYFCVCMFVVWMCVWISLFFCVHYFFPIISPRRHCDWAQLCPQFNAYLSWLWAGLFFLSVKYVWLTSL